MSLHPLVCADSALAASQNFQVVELHFEGAALATNGTILSLIKAQSVASARVHLAVGNGSNATATPSAAAVEALIKRPNGNSLSATEQNIKTGVATYLGQIAALADGARCITFAVGGLGVVDVVKAELIVETGAAKLTSRLSVVGPEIQIPEPVTLNGTALAKADGSAVALASDSLVVVGGQLNGSCATVMGVFTVPTAVDLQLAAGKRIVLRLSVLN